MIYNPKGLENCKKCKYYIKGWECKAYPEGIPHSIAIGKIIHDKPYPAHEEEWFGTIYKYPDDKGKIFEKK